MHPSKGEPQRLQAYIAQDRTYTIHCPHCNRTKKFSLSEIPRGSPNPFRYDCACGSTSSVLLVGFRASPRKTVNLPGSLIRASDTRKLRFLCTVQDISAKGMRLSTEPIKDLRRAEVIHVSIVLDNQARSKLDLPSRIRRISPAKDHLTLAVEFLALNPQHRDALDAYMQG
ncbi:MAG: PilZ domain-containing protein [Nitrospirae bacterium]|nr:PilZ domain-containing protein [Nitrospirota bacterium]